MRILLLSDIHGNLEALEAALDAAPAYDRLINLGDVVGYGGSPNEVIQRVRDLGAINIRGNHDKACSGLSDLEDFNPIAALAAYWTRQVLTPENLEWLRALPEGPVRRRDIPGVQFVHGSPLDEDEYMIGVHDALESLVMSPVAITFFGHTHLQGGFSLQGGAAEEVRPGIGLSDAVARRNITLLPNTRYAINPGSVGQPRDGDWRAGFALFNTATNTITFYRIPYDIQSAQQRILDARLPERLAARLAVGR
ncbi:MAG: metallophosphoesterase [Terriglobales bacterium]